MAKTKVVEKEMKECKHNNHSMSGGGLYGMGFIGAVVYYIQHAQTFSDGIVGVLKAAVWPAFLVYKLLEILKF